jgi:hypothetical protein
MYRDLWTLLIPRVSTMMAAIAVRVASHFLSFGHDAAATR